MSDTTNKPYPTAALNQPTERTLTLEDFNRYSDSMESMRATQRKMAMEMVMESGQSEQTGVETVATSNEILLDSLKRQPRSRAANSVYYDRTQALIWQDVFEAVYNNHIPQFICAKTLEVSVSTLHIKANYALKWLVERTTDDKEKAKWQAVRAAITLRKINDKDKDGKVVRAGVMVVNKVYLMVMQAAEKQGTVDFNKLGVPVEQHDNVERAINSAAKAVQEVMARPPMRHVWQGKFFDWMGEAKAGEDFLYVPGEADNNYKFTREDEVWLLELVTNGMSIADYRFDWEKNVLMVLK